MRKILGKLLPYKTHALTDSIGKFTLLKGSLHLVSNVIPESLAHSLVYPLVAVNKELTIRYYE